MMKKIIIIDDEILITKYLSIFLSKKFEVFPFNEITKCLSFLESNSNIDFIISDYMINSATGLNILNFIINKNYFTDYKNKFIFMTAYDDIEINNKINNTGCRLISKTGISPQLIEDIIEEQN